MFWITLKNIYVKVAPYFLVLLFIAATAVIIRLELDLKKQQTALQQSTVEMKQMQDGIVRSQSETVTAKQLDDFAKNLGFQLGDIKDDMNKLHTSLQMINSVQFGTPENKQENLPSTKTAPATNPTPPGQLSCDDGTGHCKNPDVYGVLNAKQILEIHQKFGNNDVLIGTVSFDGSKKDFWGVDIFGEKFKVTNVVTQDDNDPSHHIIYNKVTMEVNGKTYDVAIDKAETQEVPIPNSLQFDPHLHLGLDVKGNFYNFSGQPISPEITPNVDVTLWRYGKPGNTILAFPGVGVGIDTLHLAASFSIIPIEWNFAHDWKFVNNLYLTPVISISTKGNIGAGIGLKVGL